MKKVLLIAPVFFGYYKEMIKELKSQNYEVDFLRDSASSSNIYKAINRMNKFFIKLPMNRYFKREVAGLIETKQYDYILFIASMANSFSAKMFAKIRGMQNNAKFIMYQWDGEENIPYATEIHGYFDKIYTFDRLDAARNDTYSFLPLFYIENYKKIGEEKTKGVCKYDIAYIGTAHPRKIRCINDIAENLRNEFPRQFIYQYMPSKLKYYYHKITSKDYKGVKQQDLKFKKLSFDKIVEIYKQSKCIVDSPQDGQTGLTIRTIETLGSKRKLITTNEDIRNYDFYCDENILIYNGKNVENKKFFNSEYKELPKNIYEKYSISNWMKTVLGEQKEEAI